mmetsp:Transcript_10756/g.26546  ORF Transcript_10756/g.26546 Transcript_10756/m.26546 type:complete len:329 (+) Transcript_10756:27-1013(+)
MIAFLAAFMISSSVFAHSTTWMSSSEPVRSRFSWASEVLTKANPGPRLSAMVASSTTLSSSPSADLAALNPTSLSFFFFSFFFLRRATVSVLLDLRRIICLNLPERLLLTEESSSTSSPSSCEASSPSSSTATIPACTLAVCSTPIWLGHTEAASLLLLSSISFLALASFASSGGVRPFRSCISIESGYAPKSWRTTFSPSGSTSSLDAARWTGRDPLSSVFLAAFGYALTISCMISVGAPSTMAACRGSSFQRNRGASLPSCMTTALCCTTMAPGFRDASSTSGAFSGFDRRYTHTRASEGSSFICARARPHARCCRYMNSFVGFSS